jgi:hypothetical protein
MDLKGLIPHMNILKWHTLIIGSPAVTRSRFSRENLTVDLHRGSYEGHKYYQNIIETLVSSLFLSV